MTDCRELGVLKVGLTCWQREDGCRPSAIPIRSNSGRIQTLLVAYVFHEPGAMHGRRASSFANSLHLFLLSFRRFWRFSSRGLHNIFGIFCAPAGQQLAQQYTLRCACSCWLLIVLYASHNLTHVSCEHTAHDPPALWQEKQYRHNRFSCPPRLSIVKWSQLPCNRSLSVSVAAEQVLHHVPGLGLQVQDSGARRCACHHALTLWLWLYFGVGGTTPRRDGAPLGRFSAVRDGRDLQRMNVATISTHVLSGWWGLYEYGGSAYRLGLGQVWW